MNIIRDPNTVPSEGWQYPGINGHTIHTRNYSLLYHLVVQHYEANGAAAPSEQEVVDFLCNNLFIPCYDDTTRQPLINRFTQGLPTVAKGCCGGGKK